jgi:ATP-dependent RNA helicase DHX29
MGRLLSKLPTDVHLGKFLLIAALLRCLDPALTIAAALNSKSPFLTPFGHEDEADAKKNSFRIGELNHLSDNLAASIPCRELGFPYFAQRLLELATRKRRSGLGPQILSPKLPQSSGV